MKIVIPDDAPAVLGPSAAYQSLIGEARERGVAVSYYDSLPAGGEAGLLERIRGAEVVVNIRSSVRFPDSVFAACPELKLLSIWGTGTDNVDLEAAKRSGVRVTNTPGVAAPAIAEHCLALMLAVARKLRTVDQAVRDGEWPKAQAVQMRGKTLGVIGLGAIGSAFARLGGAIGMKVLGWTVNLREVEGVEMVELGELLRRSDVVSLHLRFTESIGRFLGREEFAEMKRGAIFVNTARGGLVDEGALTEALERGHLGGAGLDVFAVEPLPAGSRLKVLDNVVLTPHSAGATPETLEAGLQMASDNIWAFLDGRLERFVV